MRLAFLTALLPSAALAQAAPGDATAAGSPYASMLPLLFIFVIFYFLLIKPQQKRAKEHQVMLTALKKGDEVVTAGGIIGRIIKVDDARATVEIAKGVEVVVMKSTISTVATTPEKAATPAKKSTVVKNDNKVPSKSQIANDN
ncbi:MAG: preprotein translocase subunit YajC [Rickettsiales bacterium]